MHHLSAITPYCSTVVLSLADLCWSGLHRALPIFQWLARETPTACPLWHRGWSAARSPQPLTPLAPRLTAISLQLRDQDALLRAAAKHGYGHVATYVPQPVLLSQGRDVHQPLGAWEETTEYQPALASLASSWRLLQNTTDQRLALEHTEQGRLILHTAGALQQVHLVVHQHILDQCRAYFVTRSMLVQTGQLPHGDVYLLAYATGITKLTGVPAVSLHVQADGCVEVEVDGMGGPQGGALITALAEAMGGIVTSASAKRQRPFLREAPELRIYSCS